MSFLDRINKTKTEGTAAPAPTAAKPNPLAGRKNPLLAGNKPNPFAKPKPEPKPEVKEEVVAEETKVAVEAVVETPAETPVAEAPAKPKPAPKPAPVKKEEPAPEVTEAEVAEAATEVTAEELDTSPVEKPEESKKEGKTEEAPKEEKKKPARRQQKKKDTTSESEDPANPFKDEYYVIPTTDLESFAEVLEAIKTPFVDETWEAFRDEIVNDLSKITIADDLNPGMLKVTLSELSILREKIWLPLQEAKNEYERFTSKEPEGFIERVKRVNAVGGSNETERRRNGIIACMNYQTPVGNVNLYEALDDVRERYNFLKAAMDSIKFKSDILITMNGALKLEGQHA